jgi:hypothetical protein
MSQFLPLALALAALLTGCGTTDVNPATPRANTGYVDFYTDSDQDLSWQVRRADGDNGEMSTVYSEFKPLPGNILRLAVPAGKYRFEVLFMNQVTTGPQTVVVDVQNGKITPVHVTLKAAGTSLVGSTSYAYVPTARATRPAAQTDFHQQNSFEVNLSTAPPQDYAPKERTSYFKSK